MAELLPSSRLLISRLFSQQLLHATSFVFAQLSVCLLCMSCMRALAEAHCS